MADELEQFEEDSISQERTDSSKHSLYNKERRQESLSTVRYKVFRGTLTTWDSLFSQERLIGISHSEDKAEGVVTVWYWT
jgi:hypothetical protein